MTATRFAKGSTGDNLNALLQHIEADDDVRLFATHHLETLGGFDPKTSGPTTNLPLLAATAHDGLRTIVFDGNFLTAARGPRISEVKILLDAAMEKGGVLFGASPVDFTASMTPDASAKYLLQVPTKRLTEETRSEYTSMFRIAGGF